MRLMTQLQNDTAYTLVARLFLVCSLFCNQSTNKQIHGLAQKILLGITYSKTCVKRPLKNKQNNDLNDKWWLNEGR